MPARDHQVPSRDPRAHWVSRSVQAGTQQTPESPTRNGEVPFGTPFARPLSGLGIPSSSPSRQASYVREKSGTPESPRPLPVRRITPPIAPLPIAATDEEEAELVSPSPFDGAGPSLSQESPVLTTAAQPSSFGQASLRPAAVRIPTSSTVSTIRAPIFQTQPTPTPPPAARSPHQPHQPQKHTPRPPFPRGLSANTASGGYTNVPPPLLRSMRESFEVLDSSNSGTISAASVAEMLEQMRLPNDPSSLRTFFPSGGPEKLNLARYLDTLAAPMGELSHPEELVAAFEAFDLDDSGQIDSNELRAALLMGGGDERGGLSEREIDNILGEFGGRRHFGGKGLGAHGGMGKGEVFRYREFMSSVGGTGAGGEAMEAGVPA
ncbi:hypothetical protein LTR97_007702 [Elasticomyces elasticus]|uniref:EF-hand domain-containing protein n=1 Tax=Elasticomyces elasticus TaxID=574655 RepID=A0AAN7W8P9_9PEZI|nr:hypothetical protein LTR97_007702 [Elasticomyces elasticus]